MNRYFPVLTSLLFLTLCWMLLVSCQQKQEKSPLPPNIVLIVADDHGTADMSFLNRLSDVQTPHLDALARKSVYFSQAYASSPICSPSRMSILTAVFSQRFGTYWYGGEGIHKPAYQTIPELLKQKRYATAYIGKVHYGSGKFDSDPNHRNFPNNHGFDYFFGHTSARKHYLIHKDEEEEAFIAVKEEQKRTGQTLRKQSFWRNKEKVDTLAFSTEMIGNEARQFIQQHPSSPFFLQVSFNAVHNFTHQLPETYLKQHNLSGYHDWDPLTEDYYEWYQAGRYPNNPEGRAHYLGQLYYLDQEIGKLMTTLEEMEIAENTVVIYIGDNGGSTPIYANNSPLRGSKYLLYEGGLRVPLLISYPKHFPANTHLNNVVSGMDLLPTICALAGVPIPTNIDGFDLSPLLDGTNPALAHDTLYWDTGHERAIRVGNWKWHEAVSDRSATYEMVELELGQSLRNLASDIEERADLSDSNADKARELEAALGRWQAAMKE
ncbi:MAG: sulfatase-like hydrolase/transferase [Bacteroidota bacterium]